MERSAMAVLLAWVYERSGGSLLLAVLLHAAVNMGGYAVPLFFQGARGAAVAPHIPLVSLAYLGLPVLWALGVVIAGEMSAPAGQRSDI